MVKTIFAFAVPVLIVISLLVSGCTNTSAAILDDSQSTPVGIQEVAAANNQFAFELYSNLTQTESENIFFSPYSISTALAMTYEGARGQTADEIQSVFHFPTEEIARRSNFAGLFNRLNPQDAPYSLKTANALWVQKDYKLLDEYLRTTSQYYEAKATNMDFVEKTEESRQTINNWVADQTNQKIKDLFPTGAINTDTRLVLTNAIYFKADWLRQFDKAKTKDAEFNTLPGDAVTVSMMERSDEESRFSYAETEEAQILELPYKGKKLSMLIVLPKSDSTQSLDEMISTEKFMGWKEAVQEQRVNVFLPKFSFTTKYAMNSTLAELGMPTAFTGAADFSGLDGTRNLFIQGVIHQAFIDVHEEGTEAAAATGVIIGTTSAPAPPPVFRADHPFLFFIFDKETGAILFMGRVSNPAAS